MRSGHRRRTIGRSFCPCGAVPRSAAGFHRLRPRPLPPTRGLYRWLGGRPSPPSGRRVARQRVMAAADLLLALVGRCGLGSVASRGPGRQPEVPAHQRESKDARLWFPEGLPKSPAHRSESKVARLWSSAALPEPPAHRPESKDARLWFPAALPESPAHRPESKDARLWSSAGLPEAPAHQPESKVVRLWSSAGLPEAPAHRPESKVVRLWTPAGLPEGSDG
jgi:hypothetical protein